MNRQCVSELTASLINGSTTSVSLVETCLQRMEEHQKLGAFLEIDQQGALTTAAEIDRRRLENEPLSPLAGIPVAVKDNINIKGRVTTCASSMLENFVSPYDAHVIEQLKRVGVVLIGKTNMDEFAMGSSTEYSAFKKTLNPVDQTRVPGGSSGGSTAAVAAGLVPLAIGSSTGGSIRQPAAFCGVVGVKPTYGRVSRYGLVAYGSSLDQIGPVANDVDGAALLLEAIAGHDSRDSTSAHRPVDLIPNDNRCDPRAMKIGIPKAWLTSDVQAEILEATMRLITDFEKAGAEIVEIELPNSAYAIPAYYLVATAEASSNLARFDGVRYALRHEDDLNLKDMYVKTRTAGFGTEVKRRILLGTYCLSSGYYEGYYLNAQRVRTKIAEDYVAAFQKVDAILAPTTPTTAFAFGEKTTDPVSMYLNDIFTVTANLAGFPAMSVPAGFDKKSLPIGLQFMAAPFQEARMFEVAKTAETLIKAWT